jgi:hypothetical protein
MMTYKENCFEQRESYYFRLRFIGTKMTYEIISIRKRKSIKINTPMDIYKAIKKYGGNEQEVF